MIMMPTQKIRPGRGDGGPGLKNPVSGPPSAVQEDRRSPVLLLIVGDRQFSSLVVYPWIMMPAQKIRPGTGDGGPGLKNPVSGPPSAVQEDRRSPVLLLIVGDRQFSSLVVYPWIMMPAQKIRPGTGDGGIGPEKNPVSGPPSAVQEDRRSPVLLLIVGDRQFSSLVVYP